MESLKLADKVIVCGEAISHCVNYTVRDLVAAWPMDRRQDLVILTDCSSPVPGYEKIGEVLEYAFCLLCFDVDSLLSNLIVRLWFLSNVQEFLRDMAAAGLTLTTSTHFST